VSQTRGAAAPTSGTQDHITFDQKALDQAIVDVAARAADWAATTPRERAEILARIVRDTYEVAEEWNDAACEAKGYDPHGPEGGEELFSGVGTFIHMAQAFRQSMLDTSPASGSPFR
jgi:acyl-CoA reductase-like NAD-dependent aldehyde dehydrogenase